VLFYPKLCQVLLHRRELRGVRFGGGARPRNTTMSLVYAIM
jgi:hypothetical protein